MMFAKGVPALMGMAAQLNPTVRAGPASRACAAVDPGRLAVMVSITSDRCICPDAEPEIRWPHPKTRRSSTPPGASRRQDPAQHTHLRVIVDVMEYIQDHDGIHRAETIP